MCYVPLLIIRTGEGNKNMDEKAEHVTLEVLAYRVALTEKAIGEIRDASKAIEASLKTLTALEQHHSATREKLLDLATQNASLDARLRVIETEMPGLKMIKGWVITGTIGILGLVGAAVLKLVVGA